LKPAATFPDFAHLKGRKGTNIALDFKLRRGDTEAAFAKADHVFEHTFRTQQVMHTPMEPFVSIADYKDGHLTLHTASQGPSFVRIEIARLLGLPENRVRVKVPYLGGGFGAKLYIKLEALVTALSMIACRPVKISLTMEEQFFVITRHPCTFTIKSGVTKEGKIIARHCEVVWNGGAYADIGPRVTQKAGFTSAGPYDIDNVTINSYAVYTNRPPCGALRGFGAPQTAWAYERHTDMIAETLSIDKVEFRRKNLLREGRPQACGTLMRDAAIHQALDHVVERLIAAEVLNIDPTKIRVIHPDTDVTPYDMGTLGSRSTFHMGNAVRFAAEDAKKKISELANELGLSDGINEPVSEMLRRKYGMQAGNIIGIGSFIPDYEKPDPNTGQTKKGTPFWGVGAAGAEVEVDIETGHFTITKLINVADVGTPVNPKALRQQLSGAGIMQLGHTTTENMVFLEGQLTNGSLADYKIPCLLDMPGDYVNEPVRGAYDKAGPFGAKGAGEIASIALSPAIGNAIADAIGVHLTDLPLTPEAVFRAIRRANGTPLAGD
jgi:CO/xanthine dehydrogenase Mo-binding subunit